MQQIGISDIQRNLHKLKDFDIVEIVDKKRDVVKGYFLDQKYAYAIQTLIKQQQKNQTKGKQLAGSLSDYANTALIEQEKTAWQKQIKEQYKQ